MQQIERYGVIALVFLLVTIVAVSFWGDSQSPGFWSRLTRHAKKVETAQTDPATVPGQPATSTERAIDGWLPLSPGASALVADGAGATQPTGAPVAPTTGLSLPATIPSSTPLTTPTPGPIVVDAGSLVATPMPGLVSVAPAIPAGPEYVVQKGDSLGSIAQRTLGSASRWQEIQSLNNGIEPKSLKVGMKLCLPASANVAKTTSSPKGTPTKKPAAKESPKASGATYVVQKGDSLKSIATKKLGDTDRWKEILAMNPGLEPKKLAVGKAIQIPVEKGDVLVAAAMSPSTSSIDRPRVR